MKKLRFVLMVLVIVMVMSIVGPAALAAGDDMVLKTTGSVHLRRGPGLDYRAITTTSKNSEFDYTGVSKYDERDIVWHKVEYGSGYAWISSKYSNVYNGSIELNDSTYVTTTTSVNLRQGPGTGYYKVSTAGKDAVMFYLGESEMDTTGRIWHKVSCSSGEAWVSSRYAYIDSFEADDAYVETIASVYLREGPGLSYSKIRSYKKDTVLTYLGMSSTDYRGVEWYNVTDGTNIGWISSVYAGLYED